MPITVRRSEFSDFEALQSIVQHDGHPEIVQLDSGRMRGTLQHITLGSAFNVSTVSFSRGLRARGVLSKSRWMIGMLLAADGPVLTLEREMSAGDMAIVAPGQDRYISYRGSSRYLATFVAPEQLETFLATQPGAQDALAWRQPITMLTADRATAAANVRQLSILSAALAEHGPRLSQEAADFFQRNILELLTAPVRNAVLYPSPRVQSAVALVREVDRYLVDAGNRPIHISELCEKFNVGRRRLHRAFIDVLGIPPITFLRRKRLGDVHAALLMGGPATAKEIAVEHGFLELGRFAGAYRRLFGELPSRTLQRCIRP